MGYSIPPEREMEAIEKVAQFFVDNGLTEIGSLMLEGLMPVGELIGPLGFASMYIPVSAFFGVTGQDLLHMVGLNFRKNVALILTRMGELEKGKETFKAARESKPRQPITLTGIIQYFFPTTLIRWLRKKLSNHRS